MTEKDEILNINLDEKAINCEESIKTIASSFSSLAETILKQYEPFSESIKNITDSLTSFYDSESFKNISKITEEFSKSITPIYESALLNLSKALEQIKFDIPKIEFSEETIKNMRKIHVLELLKEHEWPLFMDIDDNFSEVINTCNIDNKSKEFLAFLENEIYKKCDKEYIDNLCNKWINSLNIKEERKRILQEALDEYKNNKYISCVSILSCQFFGIIDDIGINSKEKIDEEFKNELNDMLRYMYGNDKKRIDLYKEKNKFLYVICSLEGGPIYLDVIMKYIYMIIFGSEDTLCNGDNPSRNKICHGLQLNINSKKQALKAILTTDILINILNIFKENECEVNQSA